MVVGKKTSFSFSVYTCRSAIGLLFGLLGSSKALLLLIVTRRYPSILPLSPFPSLSLGQGQTGLGGPNLLPTLLLLLYSLL